MGLINWIRGVLKTISKNDIESSVKVTIAQSDEMTNAIRLWADMYQDSPPWKSDRVQTLNVPATIASKVAKLVTIESSMQIEGSARADYITRQIKPLWENIRNVTEFATAKGGIMLKPYIDGKEIKIDCIQADKFFPTKFDDNGNVTGCVFVAQKTIGKTIYTRLEKHEFESNTYKITNNAFYSTTTGRLGTPCSLSAVPEWQSIEPETVILNLEQPLFSYFKMPFANNIDTSSPLGVSVFSRATETIEQLDRQYSRLIWEFKGGELAIHASDDLFRINPKNGNRELPEGDKRLYRVIDGMENNTNLFQVYSPALRDTSILNGFNAFLKEIEKQCGLAFGTLSDPQSIDKTATEIVQSKQESYSTVVDVQKSLQNALERLIYSIDALATAGNLAPAGKYDTTFSWDDSIIVDKEAKRQQFWQYVSASKFPMWAYLVKFEGYTEDEAKTLASETDTSTDFFQEE